jgi:hypothetical protein
MTPIGVKISEGTKKMTPIGVKISEGTKKMTPIWCQNLRRDQKNDTNLVSKSQKGPKK